jgi:hypothetical protein
MFVKNAEGVLCVNMVDINIIVENAKDPESVNIVANTPNAIPIASMTYVVGSIHQMLHVIIIT